MSRDGESLLAGAAQVDVTPPLGTQIAGDIGRYRPTEQIRDPLHARVLVLRSGRTTVCLIAADLCGFSGRVAAELRRRVAELLGTEPAHVLMHATQNHSGPSLGNCMIYEMPVPAGLEWIQGGDERYTALFSERALRAVQTAAAALQPVTLKGARGMDGRLAFNRRFIARDGTGRFQPGRCDPDLLCPEGPADAEVSLAVLADRNDRPVAALLHHTCHPCHGYPHRWISADWPGFWSQGVRALLGGDCVALTLNGFCGNILHSNPLDPDHRSNIYLMGEKLMETTRRIQPSLKPLAAVPLACASRTLRIPLRRIPPDELRRARRLIDRHPEPIWKDAEKTRIDWDWMYALATLDLARRQARRSRFDFEIQILRLGGLAVIGWPGEPFVEAQLAIKKGSPAALTFAVHECNDDIGYIPTRQAFTYGGYETRTANWSPLDPGALESCTAATRRLLRALYR